MAYKQERGVKLYRRGATKPWRVDLVVEPDGTRLIALSCPDAQQEIVILESMEQSDFETIVDLMKSAVEPEKVQKWSKVEEVNSDAGSQCECEAEERDK